MAIPRPCAVTALCVSFIHLLSLTVQVAYTINRGQGQALQLQLIGNILRLGVDVTATVLAFTVSTDGRFYPGRFSLPSAHG